MAQSEEAKQEDSGVVDMGCIVQSSPFEGGSVMSRQLVGLGLGG